MLRKDSALNLLDIIAEADWIKIACPDREILLRNSGREIFALLCCRRIAE